VGRRSEYWPKCGDALWLGVKTDMVLFAVNTLWSISERVRGVCVDALYKSTYTLLRKLLLQQLNVLYAYGGYKLYRQATSEMEDQVRTLRSKCLSMTYRKKVLPRFSRLRLTPTCEWSLNLITDYCRAYTPYLKKCANLFLCSVSVKCEPISITLLGGPGRNT